MPQATWTTATPMPKPSLSLDDLLSGNVPPPEPSDAPIHILERPGYKRDGLYGATPFKAKVERIVALVTVQVCTSCGSVHHAFGGLYREFEGQGLVSTLSMRNAIKGPVAREDIARVQQDREEIPFCFDCLAQLPPHPGLPAIDTSPSNEGVGAGRDAAVGRAEFADDMPVKDYSNYNAPFCHHPNRCGPAGRCLREIACND